MNQSKIKFNETEIGPIPEEWGFDVLKNNCKNIQYGFTQSASLDEVGPKFLRITDIQDKIIDWKNVPFCEISESDHKKYKLVPGDIIIARTGASTGTNTIFKEGMSDSVFASYLIKVQTNEKLDPFFVHHYLQSGFYKEYVAGILGGSAQPNANAQQLTEVEIPIPSIAEQTRIAEILSSLDDKIELNRQINANLEKIASALFKRWFVDFEFPDENGKPYKSSGGKMVELELGEIPRGWKVGVTADIMTIKGGSTPSTSENKYWENGLINWATPKDLSGLKSIVLLDTEKRITEAGLKKISSGLLPVGTLLLSSRAPIGYITMAAIPVAINQGFIAINCTDEHSEFILFWLKANVDLIKSKANGSTFLEINKATFRQIGICIPQANILEAFHEVVFGIVNNLKNSELEIQKLIAIRDSLLPRLMNGKIRVI